MSDTDTPLRQPRAVYETRLTELEAVIARSRGVENAYSAIRGVLFLTGMVLGAFTVWGNFPAGWLVLPWGAFLAAIVGHDLQIRRRRRVESAAAHYRRGLARLDHRWAGTGIAGDRFIDRSHPYASDLDLFGVGSLFELLCTARTRPGQRTLARWLCSPADRDTVTRRQEAVAELTNRLELREDLAVLGDRCPASARQDTFAGWASSPGALTGLGPVLVGLVLAVGNLVGFVLWLTYPAGALPFLLSLVASGIFVRLYRHNVNDVLAAVDRPFEELRLLTVVLERLEREPFDAPLLRQWSEALGDDADAASRRIRSLARWVQLRESQHNLLFQPLAAMMLLNTQIAFALERWRRRSGPQVAGWLRALGEIEALNALANHAYEHPENPFPTVRERSPVFLAESLRHPLLEDRSVPNDVRLGEDARLWLVSGSNMSGKSTLLRTVGVNTVLALAGGTVHARRLECSELWLGASMRVVDSLQEGASHFYAEIQRMKTVMELADEHPVLFLLDEILHGTNSHDRRIGAEALIRGLLDRGAIGLVTTHDLALAAIVDALDGAAANVHFEDRVDGDRMSFDYRIKPGVVGRGNAVRLMRAIGLEV